MNKNAKFNSDVATCLKHCLKEITEISEKYEADPYILLKLVGQELVKIAETEQKKFDSMVQTLELNKKVNETVIGPINKDQKTEPDRKDGKN